MLRDVLTPAWQMESIKFWRDASERYLWAPYGNTAPNAFFAQPLSERRKVEIPFKTIRNGTKSTSRSSISGTDPIFHRFKWDSFYDGNISDCSNPRSLDNLLSLLQLSPLEHKSPRRRIKVDVEEVCGFHHHHQPSSRRDKFHFMRNNFPALK